MLIAGMIAATAAAALHIVIFYIESFAWTTRGLTIFTMSPENAQATKELAFNQGFYNLLLALQTLCGVALYVFASPIVGLTLILYGTGSMLAAALLLLATSPDKRAAAVKQGTLPLLAVTALGAAILL